MTMDPARLGRLIRKELSETLRDRRTIVTLVLMPVLLYPLLSVVFQQLFVASALTAGKSVEYRLGFISEHEAAIFARRLYLGEDVLRRRQPITDQKKAAVKPVEFPKVKVEYGSYEDLELALRGGLIDAIVRNAHAAPDTKPPALNRVPWFEYELTYRPASGGGPGVVAYIEERLAAANEAELLVRLSKAKTPAPAEVVILKKQLIADDRPSSFISLGSLVPLILILMTITGAVYPAIDLTAGERERGTLEILVAAPVPRLGLLFAKYVSVVAVAVLTALVNLVAMTATLWLSGLATALFPNHGLTIGVIVLVFLLLLLFAAFFSAVLLCITSFARSFKEAQAYLIPLMLVSMAPGVMGMMPGLELADLSWAPLINIVLLGRDLLEGGAELGPALVVVATTLIYAVAAISIAARIFGAESVLYSEQSGWADLFRRPPTPQAQARVSTAMWCLALMIPLSFVMKSTAGLLVQAQMLDEKSLIYLGPPYALVLFGVLPALFAWRGHLSAASAFGSVPPRIAAWAGAAALGVSIWPLLIAALAQLDLRTDETQQALYERVAESFRQLSPVVKVSLVVVPALLEEWFFRGFLYSALRPRAGALATIATTALLFGVMHYLLNAQMGLVRVLPSALMGLPLGFVRESSGSVWPGMLLHAIHNACLVLLIDDSGAQATTVPAGWVVAGAAGCLGGTWLCWIGRRQMAPPEVDVR